MSEKTLVKVLSGFIVMILITLGPTIGAAASEPEGALMAVRSRDAQFLDPNVATSDRSLNLTLFGSMVVRNLFDGSYSPHLAESWEVLDPKTWKFKLRQGVKFHNGDEVTSADVKFSFERSMGKLNPKFRGYRKGALKRQVASVETPDDYTVIIKTKFADASFLGVSMLLQIVPKVYVEKLGDQEYARKPVGFGPYKIKKIRVGEYIEIEAFEDYWNTKPKPGEVKRSDIKALILKTLPQQATMVAALKTGEADAMLGVQTDMSKELEELPGISVLYAPTAQHGFFIINFRAEKDPQTGEPNPLRDVRVRQALNYAINWDSIIKNYLTGREWRTTLIGRTQIGYDPNAPIYPYDPEKAKKLLAEAGYAQGVSVPFHYNEAGRGPYMDAVWEYWRTVGIKVVIKPHSAAVNLRGVYTKKSYGIINWGGGFGPDPGNWFRVMVPYNGLQAMHLAHPKVEELARKQSVEFDPKKRAEIIKELNEILLRESWFVPTLRGVAITAINTKKWVVDQSKMPLTSFPFTYVSKKK